MSIEFTRNDFMQRFQLSPLILPTHAFQFHPNEQQVLKQSAVLIPIIEYPNYLSILFTRRSKHLTHHAGQISFPGGKVDNQDESILATALREAYEEINLMPEQVTVVGQLHRYHTITGFVVTPIVGLIPANQPLVANPNEVDEIFEVPLCHLLSTNNHRSINMKRAQQSYAVHVYHYRHYSIWGATAGIIKALADHLTLDLT